jgi:hypothetical protein
MTTLKEAREKGNLKQFIKEREEDTPPGDTARFEKALTSMAQGKKKAVRGASKKRISAD